MPIVGNSDILLPHVARAYLIVNHDADQSGFEPVAPPQLFARYAALYQSPN